MATEKPSSQPVSSLGPVSHAIFRVARLHKALAGQLLREVGLHPGQELLMMKLWDEGPQRQVDLVRSLDSDAPTMTRTVRRLERAGFVRRVPSPSDRRSTIIEATQASVPLKRSVERIWAQLEELTVGEWDCPRKADVLDALEGLEGNLTAVESPAGAGN
ncbi:MarR family winged helix-turn-helix transcriptional regulator [Microbacterium sp. MPKO10]|uniref:MarR family winged helix-turn-helix transcriptional regulator n=1 Tax=Microbacterium sp. MPKO10 TaxID=2989818 RepID=UPI0022359D92|nr:MarR family transcriptional regulator [Microbacterium sp. MPKO10]MCW4457057.1 MarR family transcriptional regulator [Microbacterium sp. MPKO10]